MDPNATLKLLDEHLAAGDYDEARQTANDLATWMANGGFHPKWNTYPNATTYWAKLSKLGEFHE